MAAQPPDVLPAVISLPAQYGKQDTWFFKHLELPAGKIEHAWTAISATDFVLLHQTGRRLAEPVWSSAEFFPGG